MDQQLEYRLKILRPWCSRQEFCALIELLLTDFLKLSSMGAVARFEELIHPLLTELLEGQFLMQVAVIREQLV